MVELGYQITSALPYTNGEPGHNEAVGYDRLEFKVMDKKKLLSLAAKSKMLGKNEVLGEKDKTVVINYTNTGIQVISYEPFIINYPRRLFNKMACRVLDLTNTILSPTADNLDETFARSQLLEEIILPDEWKTDSIVTMNKTFAACYKLKEIKNLQILKSNKVIQMGGTFTFCSSLESFDVTQLDFSNVQTLESFMNCCRKLRHIEINKMDLSSVKNVSEAFGSIAIEYADLSNMDLRSLYDFSNMFFECDHLKRISLAGAKLDSFVSLEKIANNSTEFRTLILSDTEVNHKLVKTQRLNTNYTGYGMMKNPVDIIWV